MRTVVLLLLLFASLPALSHPQSRDEAKLRDLERLQDDTANLDEDLRALDPQDPNADAFRRRAEDIRDEAVYLKVKIEHHGKDGLPGTGVTYDEVADLRRSVSDLREDLARSSAGPSREVEVEAGTTLSIRVEEALSSAAARKEDRFEATIFSPVRVEGALAFPAGCRIRGVVRDVERAERPSRAGRLEVEFDAVYLGQTRLDLWARVISLRREDRSERPGISAILAGVLGGLSPEGKAPPTALAVGITGALVATRGDDVQVPEGTVLNVRLERPVTVPARR